MKIGRTMNDLVLVKIQSKEALATFFNNSVSPNFLYSAIRSKKIPAVHVMGKVLLDRDELIKWWNIQLELSKCQNLGLRKIK
jgi:hypothetical protein